MKLDWMTLSKVGIMPPFSEVTSQFRAMYLAREALRNVGLTSSTLTTVRGNPFYAYAFEDTALRVQINVAADLAKQGIMLVFNGRALSELINPVETLRKALENGWKPTRIDVALDLMDPPVTVAQIADLYAMSREETHGRGFQFISGKTGDTLYIGSRKSPKFMRIYDKGAEQGLERDQWLRFELEFKDVAALGLAAKVVDDINRCAFEMAAMLDVLVDGVSNYLWAIGKGDTVVKSTAPKPKANRVLWIKQQVVPALLTLKEDDYDGFMEAIGYLMDTVIGK